MKGQGTWPAAAGRAPSRAVAGYLAPIALFALALTLRLLVWRWHELYPLGGDEREYLDQALTLLREHRYVELRLMRPPLYTGFLAACIYLFDSLVQRLRLVQAVISALTVVPLYALARQLFRERRAAFAAGLLAALSYTLAANATELLTETLFLFGLTLFLWMLLRIGAAERAPVRGWAAWAGLAGLTLGCLALVRSVALPLLPLSVLWLAAALHQRQELRRRLLALCLLPLGFGLVVAPWTARNYIAYGALIVVDTTGAENLWLDNDPAGREAVKAQLYALGEDRATRQRLATERGLAAIAADPGRFAAKAWGEAQKFFALQFFDDMRERRAIWVPPHEVWLRLLLGDGVWLLTLFGGLAGLWLAPGSLRGARWLFVPWALYVLLTALVFHVELRYRLPLYPALLPYAGWALARLVARGAPRRPVAWRVAGAALSSLACLALMLLHRPYLAESWMLASKHSALWRAERALDAGDSPAAAAAARAAIGLDPASALARVALARAALADGDLAAAREALDAAVKAVPDHPRAHVLRGAVLRAIGETEAARADLAYETATLEDMQAWAWDAFAPLGPAPQSLDVGGGLDLGYLRGFHAAESGAYRWTRAAAELRLTAPPGTMALLELRLAGGRPAGAPQPQVTVLVDGQVVETLAPAAGWQTYRIELPAAATADGLVLVALRSDTFRPRALDRANPDNRELGVMVDSIVLLPR